MIIQLQTSRRFVSSSSAPHLVPVSGLGHGLVPHSAHSLIFPVVPPVVAGLGQGHQAQHGLTQTCVHFTLNIHYFNDLWSHFVHQFIQKYAEALRGPMTPFISSPQLTARTRAVLMTGAATGRVQETGGRVTPPPSIYTGVQLQCGDRVTRLTFTIRGGGGDL